MFHDAVNDTFDSAFCRGGLSGSRITAKVVPKQGTCHLMIYGRGQQSGAECQGAEPRARQVRGCRWKLSLVAAFDFSRQIAFVKFIGAHAEYDRVDALTASQFSR